MNIKPIVKRYILLIWILLVPAGLWYSLQAYPPHFSGHIPDLTAFLLLTCIVSIMPMVINNNPVFLVQWVLLAVFLNYGLFVETVLSQAAFIVVLLRLRVGREGWFRYLLNSLMFFSVSFGSGIIYYSIGGETGIDILNGPLSFILAAVYAVLSYLINQIVLFVYFKVVYKYTEKFFDKSLLWETVTAIIIFPIGFVLYTLYREVGVSALFFVGIPFASLSIILNLYYSSQNVNEYLQKAAEIGHQLAERVHVNDVMDLFVQKLIEMLPVDYAYVLDVVDREELVLIRRIEHGKVKPNDLPPLRKNQGISGIVWSSKKSYLFSTKKEWWHYEIGYLPTSVESVMGVPIVRNNEVVGVLILASRKKRAFEKMQLMIVDILCSHFAVAIENAKHYEITKEYSERCPLTKLYNYRYFESMLSAEFTKLHQFERKLLSLIILDIDHFKKVNDTYGHQSGNEILCELARRLEGLAGGRGTVARYGGEEFVILLPDMEKEDAYDMAERIRKAIADKPFTLKEHLEEEKLPLLVNITASIGVATAPQDADDSLALIRHADRALYVGAKRAGRNRVAEYVK